jgi:hypothetical protein
MVHERRKLVLAADHGSADEPIEVFASEPRTHDVGGEVQAPQPPGRPLSSRKHASHERDEMAAGPLPKLPERLGSTGLACEVRANPGEDPRRARALVRDLQIPAGTAEVEGTSLHAERAEQDRFGFVADRDAPPCGDRSSLSPSLVL